MIAVADVFDAAMALMDELDRRGAAQNTDTLEYEHRTPGIMNALVSEYYMLTGIGAVVQVETLEDPVLRVPDVYGLSVLPYGLAANLLADENPSTASFFQQRYEELRDRYIAHAPAVTSEITDLYGGLEYGQFSRW